MGLLRTAAVVVMLAALLVACGPAATPTAAEPSSTPAATPTATAVFVPGGTPTEPAPTASPTPVEQDGTPARPTATPDGPTETATPEPTPTAGQTVNVDGRPVACEADPSPAFSAHITDVDRLRLIMPTIVSSGNWIKNRSYHVIGEIDGVSTKLPIYAPADATLTSITHYVGRMPNGPGGELVDISQYDIRFQVSCEVGYTFDHLDSLVEPLLSIASPEPALTTRDAAVYANVDIEAGQLLGYTTIDFAHTWDFIVTNTTVTNSFANQARYESTGELWTLLNNDCPYDYYPEAMGAEYFALFGGWNGGAVGASGCPGSPDQAGTISGAWFQTPFDPAGGDFQVPDWGVVVVRTPDGAVDVNGPSNTVRSAVSAVDPKTVTSHCYAHAHPPARYAYVELTEPGVLAAAFGDGACPASLPAGHTLYYR